MKLLQDKEFLFWKSMIKRRDQIWILKVEFKTMQAYLIVFDFWSMLNRKMTGLILHLVIFFRFSLFIWGLSSHSRIFHSYGRHHNRWRAANFDICRQSWPLTSDGSLACNTYCDTGHPFIMVNCEDTRTYCWAFSSGAVATWFYDLGLSRLGFEHRTCRLRGHALTHCATAATLLFWNIFQSVID